MIKGLSKLAVLLNLGALVSLASAKTPERAYLDSCRRGAGVPVPVSVVFPPDMFAVVGSEVDLEFTVEATGKPSNVRVLSSNNANLAIAAMQAIRQWQFAPVLHKGVPVPTKVVLPVRIVKDSV